MPLSLQFSASPLSGLGRRVTERLRNLSEIRVNALGCHFLLVRPVKNTERCHGCGCGAGRHTRPASTFKRCRPGDSHLAVCSQSPNTEQPLNVTNNTSGNLPSKIGEQVRKGAQIELFYNKKLELFYTPAVGHGLRKLLPQQSAMKIILDRTHRAARTRGPGITRIGMYISQSHQKNAFIPV